MQLSTGTIHDLYVAIATVERDEKLKLSGDTWLKLARNKNAIEAEALAYQRARTKVIAGLHKANRELDEKARRSDAEIDADFAEQDLALRAEEHEVDLKVIPRGDWKLDEQGRLSGMLAKLLVITEKLEG